MKRKLVKQGIRALTITLPAAWVEKNNLKAGDEVDLTEAEAALTIATEKVVSQKEITVDVRGLIPRLADRFMARAYQKGYDKITIIFDDSETMLAIKNKVAELMGFEILNISKNKLEIQVISNQLNLDFDTLLRRAFLILMDMAETCYTAWKKEDKNALENIFYQDFDVNKFTYFCLRDLNKSQKRMEFGRSILYYLIESSEDLGDELKVLGKILAAVKPDQEMLSLIQKFNEMFRLSYEFFYKPEKKKAVQAFLLNKEITAMIENLYGKKNQQLTKALMSLDFCCRIVYHYTTMRLDTLKELSGDVAC